MPTVTPFLWFDDDLQQAVEFYTGLFPDAELVSSEPGPDGRWFTATWRMAGQEVFGLNGGPGHPFTDAISLFVEVADQAEVDRYWEALTEGGREVACGWLVDRFGLSWQIVPTRMRELLADPDPGRASRTMAEMRTQVRIDVAALERAADG